jgi:fructose-1,6-bisphosphatase-3
MPRNSEGGTMSNDRKYLKLLSQQFPTRQAAYTEIINLEAILNLPCATEHYMSDIHGELEAFTHILNNCSGVIREWVNFIYGDDTFGMKLDARTRAELCTLIYYPDEKLTLLHRAGEVTTEWYDRTLKYLVNVARALADAYTRSRVRKQLPEDYGYIIDELLHVSLGVDSAHHTYRESIVDSIIATGAADDGVEPRVLQLAPRADADRNAADMV